MSNMAKRQRQKIPELKYILENAISILVVTRTNTAEQNFCTAQHFVFFSYKLFYIIV